MMKRLLAAATVVVLSSAPALAGHCPKDVKLIDAALSKASLSSSQMSEVKNLRDNGSKLHGAKKHGDAIADLHKAMDILSLKH